MSSTPGRRAAPKPPRKSGFKVTRTPQARGGRRVADPPTGELPAVGDGADTSTGSIPVVGGEHSHGRRIRPAAPVSAAGDLRPAGVRPAAPEPTPTPLAQTPMAPPIPVSGPQASFPRDPSAPTPQEDPRPTSAPSPRPAAAPASRAVPASPPTSPPAVPPTVSPAAEPAGQAPAFPVDPSAPAPAPTGEPEVETPDDHSLRARMRTAARMRLTFWSLALTAGIVLLAAAALHVGPTWLDGVGAVAVATTYSWAVMARTGGRQVVFSVLALLLGTAAVLVDGPVLKSGAAVMTCVVSGVLAVLLTVPARTFVGAVREVVVATAVASVGAFATIGFEPVASTARFDYLTLGIGFAVMLLLVWRLAAGLHGLGTRGLATIVVGTLVLALSIVYTELLRRFGGSGVVGPGTELSGWLRETIGATPRLIVVFLGVPALLWGVHMRARRRQGWWVCVFGVVATLSVAQRLVNLDTSYVEAGLQTAYSVALGVLVGWVVIRVDQALTGTRGSRARAAEEHDAVRPEPPRFSAL